MENLHCSCALRLAENVHQFNVSVIHHLKKQQQNNPWIVLSARLRVCIKLKASVIHNLENLHCLASVLLKAYTKFNVTVIHNLKTKLHSSDSARCQTESVHED